MTDWETCPAVERDPGKCGGAWVFRGTRAPRCSRISKTGRRWTNSSHGSLAWRAGKPPPSWSMRPGR